MQREASGQEGSGDPDLDGLPEWSSEDWEAEEEPEELREARQQLGDFTAQRQLQEEVAGGELVTDGGRRWGG
jgi:hypothetical protein